MALALFIEKPVPPGRIEDAPAMIEGSRGTTVEAAGPARPTAVSTPGQAPGPAPDA